MDSELSLVRDAVLAGFTGIVLPNISKKMLDATIDAKPEDWFLLGRIFGRLENRIKKRFSKINNRRELSDLALYGLSEEVLEAYVKSSYIFAKYHRLEPSYKMLTGRLEDQTGLMPLNKENQDKQDGTSLEEVLVNEFGV